MKSEHKSGPRPIGTSDALQPSVRDALEKVVHYLWHDEWRHYAEQQDARAGHIFESLFLLQDSLDGASRKEPDARGWLRLGDRVSYLVDKQGTRREAVVRDIERNLDPVSVSVPCVTWAEIDEPAFEGEVYFLLLEGTNEFIYAVDASPLTSAAQPGRRARSA